MRVNRAAACICLNAVRIHQKLANSIVNSLLGPVDSKENVFGTLRFNF